MSTEGVDLNIVVLNEGPQNPENWIWGDPDDPKKGTVEFLYGGKNYIYEVGKPTIVPYEVAKFHFAVELQGGKLVRDKGRIGPDGKQSWYDNRIAQHSPYGLLHGRESDRNVKAFNEWRNWYANRIRFGIHKTSREMSPDEFLKLKGVVH